MSRIVCNTVEFVFRKEVATMNPGEAPVLKEDVFWKKIIAEEKPVYNSFIKQNDSGPTNEETVTAKARKNNITELLIQYCGFYTILRMTTDEGIFFVGNLEYPCSLEYTSDKVFENYSFKAISPA